MPCKPREPKFIYCSKIRFCYLIWVYKLPLATYLFFIKRIMSKTTATATRTGPASTTQSSTKKVEQPPVRRQDQPATKKQEEDFSKYVKKGVSEEAVRRLKECFDIFDYDGSGEVTTLELKNAIVALGKRVHIQGLRKMLSECCKLCSNTQRLSLLTSQPFWKCSDSQEEAKVRLPTKSCLLNSLVESKHSQLINSTVSARGLASTSRDQRLRPWSSLPMQTRMV